MPSKTSKKKPAAVLPSIPKEVIDQFVSGPMTAEAVNAASMAFKKALIERALGAELSHHLGYPPGTEKPAGSGNHRNGVSGKTVLTGEGPLRIDVPRDRAGSFEPLLIPKHERRFTGFDDKIVAMYARGMTVREIQGFLVEQYGTEVSPEFIGSVTDAVMAEVTAWQARPLEPMYPVVFFDCLRVKIREDAVVRNKAIYLALGILPDGTRDILGLWIENTEGAKFWMKVFNDLKTPRGSRHPDCCHRRPEGHGRSPGSGVSGHHLADLHRASDPQQPGLRELEGSQGTRGGDQADLHRPERRGRADRTGCLRGGRVGPEVSDRGSRLASSLGSGDSVLCVSRPDP
jgi:Transposase and inactivated derivatives